VNSGSQLISSGLWRWLQGAGLERFEFVRAGEEWIMRGTIVTLAGDAAAEAKYELACNHSFHTTRAQLSLREAQTERSLQIAAENGRWYANGREDPKVKGAIDIDLGWSPVTNTLPIRRLKLEIGQASGEFHAAWVRFPELVLEPLPQEYFRVSERVYRYSSRGGAFNADLLVDEHGLVVNYQGFWERVQSEA
jgi:uncharacterized protein